jgi:hypothetical protein
MDRHDAGVLQLAADLRLLHEALDDGRVVLVLVQQHLDGQIAAQLRIAALEDQPYAAPAQHPCNFVARDGRPLFRSLGPSGDGWPGEENLSPRRHSQGAINGELVAQLVVQVGEAVLVLRQGRCLAGPFAQDDLLVNQVQDSVGLPQQLGVALQEVLHPDALPLAPASLLLVQQQVEQLRGGQCRSGVCGARVAHGLPPPGLASFSAKSRPDWL